MDPLLAVLLIGLATHRLTVLVVEDKLAWIARPRAWVQNRCERATERRTGIVTTEVWQSSIAYMLSCMWCRSIWIGGVVTIATAAVTDVPLPALTWLAASSTTALLGGHRA